MPLAPVDSNTSVQMGNLQGGQTYQVNEQNAFPVDATGCDTALHCSPDGAWVEPHVRRPRGGDRNQILADPTFGDTAYRDTLNFTNPDGYDKHIFVVVNAIIDNCQTGLGGSTHHLRISRNDKLIKTRKKDIPYNAGATALVPSIICATALIPIPAGAGMGTPEAPPAIDVTVDHWYSTRPAAAANYGRNRLYWSWVIA